VANIGHILFFSLAWEVRCQTVGCIFVALVIAVLLGNVAGKRLFMHSTSRLGTAIVLIVAWDRDVVCASSDSDTNVLGH